MWEITEMCINPFDGMYTELGAEFGKKLDEFCLAGDPDVYKYIGDIYAARDWRKCEIPEVLKPYIKKGYKPRE
nr:MAG TPA: hypothetical protein [Caudoviricetes sp.]